MSEDVLGQAADVRGSRGREFKSRQPDQTIHTIRPSRTPINRHFLPPSITPSDGLSGPATDHQAETLYQCRAWHAYRDAGSHGGVKYLGHPPGPMKPSYVAAAVARISPRCLRRRLACPPSTSITSRTSHARNAPPPQGVPCELHAVPGICPPHRRVLPGSCKHRCPARGQDEGAE
jgi:hypothetical protein